MKKKYWFKAKRYGWGWYPASLEGWMCILVYLVLMWVNFRWIDLNSHSGSDTLYGFFPTSLVLTGILIGVSYLKGEKPGWRWGDSDKKKKK